jgi:putative spermidine/putrescine transport system substrate-binding protein
VLSPTIVQKVKNSPDLAWEYINTMCDAERQAVFSSRIPYAVTNRNVVYPENIRDRVPRLDETRWPPFADISRLSPDWMERWNREVGA